ncbi:MAG: TetR/AcrR family transcriptional regulator, partial [Gemmatimonadota bacterium]|nr:TetR/AcrR family transcriptional regulator [Gemmatimonadota bacterium]
MTSSTSATSRDAILDAALRCFAAKGYAATTIKDLASEADVNSALLYYYFADKETLYRETLRHVVRQLGEAAGRRIHDDMNPDEAIRRFVEQQAEFLVMHPHVPRLLLREMLEHTGRHAEAAIVSLVGSLFETLCDVIRRGQEQELFRDDVDPRYAAISTVSLVAYFVIARPIVGIALGDGLSGATDQRTRDYGRHAAEFALVGLGYRAPP